MAGAFAEVFRAEPNLGVRHGAHCDTSTLEAWSGLTGVLYTTNTSNYYI